jgi:hypothetical protein
MRTDDFARNRHMKRLPIILGVLAAAASSSCALETGDAAYDESDAAVAVQQSALSRTCTIQIGGGGATYTYSASLDEGESMSWSSVTTSQFIRTTSGPCHFRVYNGTNFSGSSVVLGTDLTERIRAGIDGITLKDDGGGDTWNIRSLIIGRKPDECRLNIGGNGVRMGYFANANPVPAMDRISEFLGSGGGDCGANIWNDVDYGADDHYNRNKSLHPSDINVQYDPGFKVRSLKIWDDGNTCPLDAQDNGRCLPQISLATNLYGNFNGDRDADGLDDRMEDLVAEAFRPAQYNHSSENGTRTGIFTDASGVSVIEPATVFQVRPDGIGTVKIIYMKLWLEDVWDGDVITDLSNCSEHHGDSQWTYVWITTRLPGNSTYGFFWHVFETSGGIDGDLAWHQNDGSLRGAHFVRGPGESGIPRHLAIYYSKGKHHEYADSGWSGVTDKQCGMFNAYVNGRGEDHNPPYPFRLAAVRSPYNRGDAFHYSNVGSKAHHFFNDLVPFGFPDQCVFGCGDFYSDLAKSVDSKFQ